MKAVLIEKARMADCGVVSLLIEELLLELEPKLKEKISNMNLLQITKNLICNRNIYAFIAREKENPIGVITLHECAAIYAGGLFGEISELFVKQEFRSCNVGQKLLAAATELANQLGWQRLEVGTPNAEKWSRTISFYKKNGFKEIGPRLRFLPEKLAITKPYHP